MRTRFASEAGSSSKPNEDIALVGPGILVVLDGLTERTDTGCIHGVAWYVKHLAGAILEHAGLDSPRDTLGAAIAQTADLHRDSCDLAHAGTPASAVGIVQFDSDRLRYVVLGDVTIVVDSMGSEIVISDDRIERASEEIRAEVNSLTADSPEKEAALVRMKHAELAIRNTEDGYWIAASDPSVIRHAFVGEIPLADVQSVAMLTDGAARLVDLFGLASWRDVLDSLSADGPDAHIRRVRAAEESDPVAARWPRNKVSDDATAIICDLRDGAPTRHFGSAL